jgi:hypothetical protein
LAGAADEHPAISRRADAAAAMEGKVRFTAVFLGGVSRWVA